MRVAERLPPIHTQGEMGWKSGVGGVRGKGLLWVCVGLCGACCGEKLEGKEGKILPYVCPSSPVSRGPG